jgi:hypothetical protein
LLNKKFNKKYSQKTEPRIHRDEFTVTTKMRRRRRRRKRRRNIRNRREKMKKSED